MCLSGWSSIAATSPASLKSSQPAVQVSLHLQPVSMLPNGAADPLTQTHNRVDPSLQTLTLKPPLHCTFKAVLQFTTSLSCLKGAKSFYADPASSHRRGGFISVCVKDLRRRQVLGGMWWWGGTLPRYYTIVM